jgi:hypothetical protein
MADSYEYRVAAHEKDKPEHATKPTENQKEAGEVYRNARNAAAPGETVAIQRRTLGPWKDIERETKP